uniref:Uncharacterized protein n=1 Tax=Candidatus Kentrum sp. LPFa TaxID=2126335 RepID=A0A450W1Q8_9GAMM|nr:MAG: hypothetical protein BECKLPF1236B_GA0070989_101626 [Candidatus Kentron sp. LPFa]
MSKDKNPKNNQPDDAKGSEQQKAKSGGHPSQSHAPDEVRNGNDSTNESLTTEEVDKKNEESIPSSEEKGPQTISDPGKVVDEKTPEPKKHGTVKKNSSKQEQRVGEGVKMGDMNPSLGQKIENLDSATRKMTARIPHPITRHISLIIGLSLLIAVLYRFFQ